MYNGAIIVGSQQTKMFDNSFISEVQAQELLELNRENISNLVGDHSYHIMAKMLVVFCLCLNILISLNLKVVINCWGEIPDSITFKLKCDVVECFCVRFTMRIQNKKNETKRCEMGAQIHLKLNKGQTS